MSQIYNMANLQGKSHDTWGFPKIKGTLSGVPIIRTVAYWGSMLGSHYLGKLPHTFSVLKANKIQLAVNPVSPAMPIVEKQASS